MGRGLSDLQKTILRLGLEAREWGVGADEGWPDVYQIEVLVEHFGWPCPPADESPVEEKLMARRQWADSLGRMTYPYMWASKDRYLPYQNDPGLLPSDHDSHRAAHYEHTVMITRDRPLILTAA